MNCYVQSVSALCALGGSNGEIAAGLARGQSPLQPDSRYSKGAAVYLGRAPLADDAEPLPLPHNSRNNRLLRAAARPLAAEVETLKARFGAHRLGVVLGTSTSGISEGEAACAQYQATGAFPDGFHYQQQEIGAPALFLAEHLGLGGPAFTISTACTSGSKALASARRLLRLGACDAVIAGAADSLCRLTVQGFASLGAVSRSVCTPFAAGRDGINIGEAAVLFILSREEAAVRLSGCGETSDAYHISGPDPTGAGAEAAMRQALEQAGLTPGEVDYVSLHGTGTVQNDAMESAAVHRIFGSEVNCSFTKPLTGHTLGATGALEAAFCHFALCPLPLAKGARLAPQAGAGPRGPRGEDIAPLERLFAPLPAASPRHALSASFAFGGSNTAILLSRQGG